MRSLMPALCVLCLATNSAPAQSRASQAANQFGWHTSLDGAKTAARQTGKPIFLVFRCDP